MTKHIQLKAGKHSMFAEETDNGLELNLEGETVAVLEYDEESKSFKLYAYGDEDEPAFTHEYKL
ncbi:hypothetical protein Goe7_c02490 [Bacillus phage vB_BveM-Goe7]|nr:hypothetical protein Goe7_c00040 [Bacillus phage vB_BveM-Goe7]QDP43274.1 hypothetical protein Goe7_c02490 [Bacillus phage vB_BveM-Goe7]UPI13253.1 hypothetical protein [Bacillus phage SBSphiJ7]